MERWRHIREGLDLGMLRPSVVSDGSYQNIGKYVHAGQGTE